MNTPTQSDPVMEMARKIGMTILELAERCEKATADDQRDLLAQAWQAVRGPKPDSDYQPRRTPMFSPDWERWVERDCRFSNLLQAEAYESAAMMLVPEGWTGIIPVTGGDEAWLWPKGGTFKGFRVNAATPALALTAACLRANHHLKGSDE